MTNSKYDISYHQLLKRACNNSYHSDKTLQGCEFKGSKSNLLNGFQADVLKNGDKIIIVYRGTNTFLPKIPTSPDLTADFMMSRSRIPAQSTDALKLHDEVKRQYPNAEIIVTGHSLGGSLAQIVSALRGAFAVTFNAYGTKDMFKDKYNLKTNNAINYVVENDWIGMSNAENNIGITYAVPQNGKNPHKLENIGDLSQREFRSPAELEKNWRRLHPNTSAKKDRINDFCKTRDNLKNTIANGAHEFTQGLLHSNLSGRCAGAYYVSGYTTKDGKKVDGYTRDCWRHK